MLVAGRRVVVAHGRGEGEKCWVRKTGTKGGTGAGKGLAIYWTRVQG